MSEYGARVVRGTSWVLALSIVGAIIGYLTRIYLARVFSVEDYGLFYAVLTFMALFSFIKEFGLNTALVKHISGYIGSSERSRIKTLIFSVICLQMVFAFSVAIFFIATADYWALNYFKTASAALPLQIIAFSFAISMFITLLQSVFQGFGMMRYFAATETLRITTITASVVGLVGIAGLGVVGAAWSYVIAAVVAPVVMFIVAMKVVPRLPGAMRASFSAAKEMWLFGLPVFMASIGAILLGYTDTILLVGFRSLEEVGLYNVALPTSQLLWFFVGSLSATLLPTVSELWASEKKDELKKGMKILVKTSFFIIVPLAIMMAAFSDNIIVLLFGGKYLGGAAALQILSASSIFYTIFVVYSTFLMGIGKPWDFAKVYAISALCFIGIGVVLIPWLGIVGAAVTSVTSYIISMMVAFYYVRKNITVEMPKMSIAKIFSSGILLLVLVLVLKSVMPVDIWTKVIVCTVIGIIFYVFISIRMGVFDKEDRRYLSRMGIRLPKKLSGIFAKFSGL